MSASGVFAIAAVIVAVAAIVYVWRHLVSHPDQGDDDVRRIDFGTDGFAAQSAHAELEALGVTTRIVTLEDGAFGIGLGEHWYLVYNTDDEHQVREIVGDDKTSG